MIHLSRSWCQLDRALAERLARSGYLSNNELDAFPGLELDFGMETENSAFELGAYCTGCTVWVELTNTLARVVPREWQLELPWNHPDFEWLPDPADQHPSGNVYAFGPEVSYSFAREEAINHKMYRTLARGDFFRGFLLGRATGSIPIEFRHRQKIEGKITIWDSLGRSFSSQIGLLIDRSWSIANERRRRRTLKVVGRHVMSRERVA